MADRRAEAETDSIARVEAPASAELAEAAPALAPLILLQEKAIAKPDSATSVLPKIEIGYTSPGSLQLEIGEFLSSSRSAFGKIAPESSGQLSKETLLKAVLNGSFKGKEAQALVSLFSNFEQLKDLDKGTDTFVENRISKEDLSILEELQKQNDLTRTISARTIVWAKANPGLFKFGGISQAQIHNESRKEYLSDFDKEVLEYMNHKFQNLKGKNGKISLKDLEATSDEAYSSQQAKLLSDIRFASTFSIRRAKPEPVDKDEFKAAAEALFSKLDKDKTGQLSFQSISRSVSDKTFQGQEAQVLAAIYRNFQKLQDLDSAMPSFQPGKLSRDDLSRLYELINQSEKQRRNANELVLWASTSKLFKADSSKAIGLKSIERELKRKDLPEQDKKMLSKLKEHHVLLENPKGGISLRHLQEAKESTYRQEAYQLSLEIDLVTRSVFEVQQEKAGKRLFGAENALDSIKPEYVIQNGLGNCSFIAAITALASTDPESIKDSILDNGNGTYTVKFPGWKYDITITEPSDAEKGLYSKIAQQGLWVSVIEKAYGQFLAESSDQDKPLQENTFNRGGRLILEFLTGKESVFMKLDETAKENLLDTLDKAFLPEKKWPVLASIAPLKGNAEKTSDGFAGDHQYTVLDYKRDKMHGAWLTIRNPNDDGSKNGPGGTITITLEKFLKNFTDITTVKQPVTASNAARS